VDRNTILEYGYLADDRSLRNRPSPPRRSARGAAVPLTGIAGLIVAVLSSLGLWAAIWVVFSLASGWLR
jgi:hypothetical protein